MKITILSHSLSDNAAMRAHRLALAARKFAKVTLLGPVGRDGLWPALPKESWIKTVPDNQLPKFVGSIFKMLDLIDGDVIIACKPYLASFGTALLAAERKQIPVILDLDDFDLAFTPRSKWNEFDWMSDPRRSASALYLSLLTKAVPTATAITVSSTALQEKFGGTLIPHGTMTDVFNPAKINRAAARKQFGFTGPTILFPGTPRSHKGLETLAKAVERIPDARLATFANGHRLFGKNSRVHEIPMLPCTALPQLLAAADVVAIPQLEDEAAFYQMPMKVYDAMAMAKPIVASAISDLPAALNGCAKLVQPGDLEQLAWAISDLLSDPAKAQRLGEKARARCVKNYSIEVIAKKLLGVVQEAADSAGC